MVANYVTALLAGFLLLQYTSFRAYTYVDAV